jgi:hypothetical protein
MNSDNVFEAAMHSLLQQDDYLNFETLLEQIEPLRKNIKKKLFLQAVQHDAFKIASILFNRYELNPFEYMKNSEDPQGDRICAMSIAAKSHQEFKLLYFLSVWHPKRSDPAVDNM